MKTVRLPFSAGIIPALVLLAFAVGGWWIAQEWGAVAECSHGSWGRLYRTGYTGARDTRVQICISKAETLIDSEEFRKQLFGFGWLGLLLLMIYLLGFMVTVVLYVFLFLRLHGRFSYLVSTSIAIGSVAFVYLIFRRLLEYSLFPGILW